jgi:predicted O-linked N-acetylglucosamine transferase (SPINDLY family)
MQMAPTQSLRALAQAAQLQHEGKHAEAEAAYLAILRRHPASTQALHRLALLYAQRGRFEEARQRVDQALGLDPTEAELHFHRAEIVLALGLQDQAEEGYLEALRLRPDFFDALVNLAEVLLRTERAEQALTRLDHAVRLRPDDLAAQNNRGNALQALKRHAEALQCFDRTLALAPGQPDVLSNRANALLSLGLIEEAESACRQALAQRPENPRALANLGRALGAQGRLAEALQQFDAAVTHAPGEFDAWCDRGAIQRELQQHRAAAESLKRALALRPEAAHTCNDLGEVLRLSGEYPAALRAFERALELRPAVASFWANKGHALTLLQRQDLALTAYAKAVECDPDVPYAEGHLACLNASMGDWRGYAAKVARIAERVRCGARAIEPLELLYLSDDAEDQLRCAREFTNALCGTPQQDLWQGGRLRQKRIKLAYVSADFREHPVSYLLAELFEIHDRSRFELFGISIGPHAPGAMASRVATAFDHFVQARDLTDREIAEHLHREGIAIAVDLMGHTTYSRPGIFSLRPCPVQVNYLGYPGTVGADFLDYLIADAYVVPPAMERCYAEKIVRLPDTFLCNDSKRSAVTDAPGRVAAGLPPEGVVYCCFNNPAKFSPGTFELWMQVLREVPRSVLWLPAGHSTLEANLRGEAAACAVDPERLVFAPRVNSNADHLARLALADAFLDTFPYNAHATASDALWAGVPVVTRSGEAFAARVAGSLLHAIGMPELIAATPEEYVALALRLGREPRYLATVKAKLAAHRLTQPLFDTERFRRHIEAAYETMWYRHQRGEAPASFTVEPLAAGR